MEKFENIKWMDEKINSLPKNNGIYKFVCLFLGKKKLSYKEMYLLLFNINKSKMDETKCKEIVMNELINIYYFNNKKLPNLSYGK